MLCCAVLHWCCVLLCLLVGCIEPCFGDRESACGRRTEESCNPSRCGFCGQCCHHRSRLQRSSTHCRSLSHTTHTPTPTTITQHISLILICYMCVCFFVAQLKSQRSASGSAASAPAAASTPSAAASAASAASDAPVAFSTARYF